MTNPDDVPRRLAPLDARIRSLESFRQRFLEILLLVILVMVVLGQLVYAPIQFAKLNERLDWIEAKLPTSRQ